MTPEILLAFIVGGGTLLLVFGVILVSWLTEGDADDS